MLNINAGYGRGVVDSLATKSASGRIFVVGASTLPGFNEVQQLFRPDTFGKVRYFFTLELALAATVSGRGDTIYVLPGHTESITSATQMVIATNGVSVIGMGTGFQRPYFTLTTATTATIKVTGSDVMLQNVIIDATGYAAVAAAITVTGAGFQLLDSVVILANSTNQAVLGVSHSGVDRLTIQRVRFQGTSNAGTTAAVQFIGGNDHLITDNFMIGAYGSAVGPLSNITTASLRVSIARNTLQNLTAANTKAITFVSGTTGEIQNNYMQILSGTAPITAAGCSWVSGNYYANAVATAGTLI